MVREVEVLVHAHPGHEAKDGGRHDETEGTVVLGIISEVELVNEAIPRHAVVEHAQIILSLVLISAAASRVVFVLAARGVSGAIKIKFLDLLDEVVELGQVETASGENHNCY